MSSSERAYICTGCQAIYWEPVTQCDCEEQPDSMSLFIEATVSWNLDQKSIVCLHDGEVIQFSHLVEKGKNDASG
jgi:hypothetical protein